MSAPSAPWIPATSSPAAGRGTWAECSEDPAAPEGCGCVWRPQRRAGDGHRTDWRLGTSTQPTADHTSTGIWAPSRGPEAAREPRQPYKRGCMGVIYSGRSRSASWRRGRAYAEARSRSGQREVEVRLLSARGQRPDWGQAWDSQRGSSLWFLWTWRWEHLGPRICLWFLGIRKLLNAAKANPLLKSPSPWAWREGRGCPVGTWDTSLLWPFIPHYLLPQLLWVSPCSRYYLGVS